MAQGKGQTQGLELRRGPPESQMSSVLIVYPLGKLWDEWWSGNKRERLLHLPKSTASAAALSPNRLLLLILFSFLSSQV